MDKNGDWIVPKDQSFLRRNKMYFIYFFGLLGAHLLWYKVVDNNVPEAEKHRWVKFVNKYDPTKKH